MRNGLGPWRRWRTAGTLLAAAWLTVAAVHAAVEPQGRVLTVEGTVELSADAGASWSAARADLPVFAGTLIKTGARSRAAVLLADETQLRLNAHSVLEIKRVQAANAPAGAGGAGGTSLGLAQGEAWVRSKNTHRSLAVDTPAATAAIRGTEIDVRVAGQLAEVVVVEGAIDFVNAQGSVSVAAGEGGRAEVGKAPTKYTVVDPEDAVQWVLFYPDFGSVESASVAERAAVAAAGEALATGDAATAISGLEALLVAEPRAPAALATLALVRLTQNRVDVAADLVDRALAAAPGQALAELVAAKVAQARFDLPAAVAHARRAAAADPRLLEAVATEAELLYGSGETAAAGRLADGLLAEHPDDARVLALHGFLAFGRDRMADARADFERAIALDPARADAHLGLGLWAFNQRDIDRGLGELLTATTLEPRLALYQSYLGKAYYQARRFVEALVCLGTAKRLDPHDPTPHLYAALIERDLDHQQAAIAEVTQAIAKNDYRAVYRSRLLLDRDQATRNVSLAEIYADVAHAAAGAWWAGRSLDSDFGSSAAHLFAAGTYGDLPDRTNAASSEFLLARMLLPVNQNAFATFNEYTSLYEVPDVSATVDAQAGNRGLRGGGASVYGGNKRVAFFATADNASADRSVSINSDREQWVYNALAKVALGPDQALFFNFEQLNASTGDPGEVAVVVDSESSAALAIRLVHPPHPDPNNRLGFRLRNEFVGYQNRLAANQDLLVLAVGSQIDRHNVDPDLFAPDFPCGLDRQSDTDRWGGQLLYRLGLGDRRDLFVGADVERRRSREARQIFCGSDGSAFDLDPTRADDRFATYHSRFVWRTANGSALTLGLRYEDMAVEDTFVTNVRDVRRLWSPQLGIRWQLSPTSSLRLAAFRDLTGHGGERLEPSSLAGFAVRRSENERTQRDEVDVAYDRAFSADLFASASVFWSDAQVPVYTIVNDGADLVRGDSGLESVGGRLDVDCRLSGFVTCFGELQVRSSTADAFDQRDRQAVVGLRLVHPSGWLVDVRETYLRQRFSTDFVGAELPETDVFFTDVTARRRFAHKRGQFGLELRNLFDQDFDVVVEGLSVTSREPGRTARVFGSWTF